MHFDKLSLQRKDPVCTECDAMSITMQLQDIALKHSCHEKVLTVPCMHMGKEQDKSRRKGPPAESALQQTPLGMPAGR